MRDSRGFGERLVRRRATSLVGVAVAAAALLLHPADSRASIPPSLSLLVLSDDPHTEALSRSYVEFLVAGENFLVAGRPLSRRTAVECLGKAGDVVSCIAEKLAASPKDGRAPPVVVIARPVKGGISWLCVGSDPKKVGKTSKRVTIDLQAALFGTGELRAAQRAVALGCLFGAAAEAQGIIRQ
ncbi:MAG TPA: hypothetical protein VF582_08700 [Allosphingosinicella sp.]